MKEEEREKRVHSQKTGEATIFLFMFCLCSGQQKKVDESFKKTNFANGSGVICSN